MSAHPTDPVNLDPIPPLRDSYVYHSSPYIEEQDDKRGWIMGIDEAGRGRKSSPYEYRWSMILADVQPCWVSSVGQSII